MDRENLESLDEDSLFRISRDSSSIGRKTRGTKCTLAPGEVYFVGFDSVLSGRLRLPACHSLLHFCTRTSTLYCQADWGCQRVILYPTSVLGHQLCTVRQTGGASLSFFTPLLYSDIDSLLPGRLEVWNLSLIPSGTAGTSP